MELRHLRYFVAVATDLHFSRASRRLHVAQPALSRQIRDLENELGVALLHRNSHSVRLTDAGRAFLERVTLILQSVNEATDAARRAASGDAGRLTIAFIGALTHEFLPQLLQGFRREFPGVDLRLNEVSPALQLEEIAAGRLDVGFVGMTDGAQSARIQVETLFDEPLVVALPTDHAFASRTTVALERLADERWLITARRHESPESHWLLGICRQLGFEPTRLMEVDRAPTVLNYIAAGYGVSAFPRQIAKLPAPGVTFVAVPRSTPRYRYSIAWQGEDASAATRQFLDFARRLAAASR